MENREGQVASSAPRVLIGDRSERYEAEIPSRAVVAPYAPFSGRQRPVVVRPAYHPDPHGPRLLDAAQDRLGDVATAAGDLFEQHVLWRLYRFRRWDRFAARRIERLVDAPALWSSGHAHRALMLCVIAGAIVAALAIGVDQLVLRIINHAGM